MSFHYLKLREWKQFASIELEIHPHVTIITGANGAGKTTIVNLFARHFGWGFHEVATPEKDKTTGSIGYRFLRWLGVGVESDRIVIGEIRYGNSVVAKITIPKQGESVYQPAINDQQQVEGLAIPSHRPVYRHSPVHNVITQKRSKQDAFNLSNNLHIQGFFGGHHQQPVNYNIKETLIAWAIFGEGNKHIDPDPQQAQWFAGFEETLRKVLPPHIGFKNLVIRGQNDVVLVATPNDFVIDAVSGGLSAIIDLAWQIYLRAKEREPITVVIDEVENHLHAAMQRRLLPSFIEAFPNVQFIVTTHSPLIVGSVKDSAVYALRYNHENKVQSERLDLTEKAQAANEILREVLDVPFTMPIWVETKLDEIVVRFAAREFDRATAEEFRREMTGAGLGHLTSEGLMRIAEKQR